MTNQNELYHYGVLGMKWGIRKDPERAFRKSRKKQLKLEKKASKYKYKATKMQLKSERRAMRGMDSDPDYAYRIAKRVKKAEKYARKGEKWVERMEKEFSKIDIDSLPEEDVSIGKEYVKYISALQAEQTLRNYRR